MLNSIYWIARIFWACRISIMSGALGVFLFWKVVPAQNLMADLSFSGPFWGVLFWAGVFLLTIVLWALPIHFGARQTLADKSWILSAAQARLVGDAQWRTICRDLHAKFYHLILWLPRALGLVPFCALALGVYLGAIGDKGASGLDEGQATLRLAWILFAADCVAAVIYALIVWRRRWVVDRMIAGGHEGALEFIRRACLLLTVLIFVAAFFAPIAVSVYFPRALLIPSLFGCLVLALSELQTRSHRYGLPLIAIMAGGALCLTAFNAPFHDLRLLPPQKPVDERVSLADAIAQWRRANKCAAKGPCARRPLVVAIDGGASRAAFTAATMIGVLLDRTTPKDGGTERPGRSIFAISGVSGGAFGAAVIQAALLDAKPADRFRPPCRTPDRTWFGTTYRRLDNETFSWRECLQALTSGDYLSPTIIGLAFRDFFAPPHMPIEDRAVLLEQSWERHYDYSVKTHANRLAEGRPCPTKPEGPGEGLCRHIGRLKPFLAENEKDWVPLLLLGGTSVQTGRRIIASDLVSKPEAGHGGPVFAQAFDLTEMLAARCPDWPAHRADIVSTYETAVMASASAQNQTIRTDTHGVCANADQGGASDLRLSTAALISARFPLISPAGSFAMKGSGFGDRVVDGGYFENSGITTALEIAQALKAASLDPMMLSIANEPDVADAAVDKIVPAAPTAGLPQRRTETPLVDRNGTGFAQRLFGLLEAPIDALLATRDGHAAEAEAHAEAYFSGLDADKAKADHAPDTGFRRSFYRARVAQKPALTRDDKADAYYQDRCVAIWSRQEATPLSMAKLSMSWWLSALVQADLDAQKCSVENRKTMDELILQLDKGAS